jgi:hypothetical protein
MLSIFLGVRICFLLMNHAVKRIWALVLVTKYEDYA